MSLLNFYEVIIFMFKDRFEILHYQEFSNRPMPSITIRYEVHRDKETGVLYYVASGGGGAGGITPILDPDGKPLIDKSE